MALPGLDEVEHMQYCTSILVGTVGVLMYNSALFEIRSGSGSVQPLDLEPI